VRLFADGPARDKSDAADEAAVSVGVFDGLIDHPGRAGAAGRTSASPESSHLGRFRMQVRVM